MLKDYKKEAWYKQAKMLSVKRIKEQAINTFMEAEINDDNKVYRQNGKALKNYQVKSWAMIVLRLIDRIKGE